MSTVIVIIGTLICVFFLLNSKKQQEDALIKFGTSIVMLLAQDNEVKNALSFTQPAFLDTPISRITALDREKEIGYLHIYNLQSTLIEETAPWINISMEEILTSKSPKMLSNPHSALRWRRGGGARVIESTQDPDVLIEENIIVCSGNVFHDFTMPVLEKPAFSEEEFAAQILGEDETPKEKKQKTLGFVQVGLSPYKLNERINKIIWQRIVPMGLIIISGGIGITFLLSKYFVTPLKYMASITLDIARGDLTRTVDIRSDDEIGQLSLNFNSMTRALKVSYDEKENILAQLRENVNNLEKANEELVNINEQLSETQERLVRSEKLAVVGKLASGVGHELRNPLGAIKTALYIIRKTNLNNNVINNSQKSNQLFEIIEKETERSVKIVNDLLGFSRTAKPVVSLADIKSIIESSLSRVKIPSNIEQKVLLEEPLPLISVDATQIDQVFVNLIQNACDAMQKGGLLTIHARKENEFLTVAFTDTGCGIPENAKNKIFDPLFTTKPKGMGLGLAISVNIIQRHEGYIDLKSKEGEGASFIVKLPITKT
ncbi:MAG TPA: sensor histidine kinase [Candidatus Wujingus californicus]|uniref:sensor histidine kinase n=3 Tax=Candidatus Wujingus californicus TaxID=3367618 RepID=UPI001D384F93|nr:HAMP domain-containing protein [Planctomycetota bacterium]